MKRIAKFYYAHWAIINSFLLVVFSDVLIVLIFHIDCWDVDSPFPYILAVSYFLCAFPYGLLKRITDDSLDSGNYFIANLITICILTVFVSTILLGRFVLSYTVQYEDKEYYEQEETVCYITETGDCYHREDCGYLHSKIKTTVSSAKAKGYSPCTYCWTDYTTQTRLVTKERIEHHYILSYIISLVFWIGISALIIVIHIKRIKKKQATPE